MRTPYRSMLATIAAIVLASPLLLAQGSTKTTLSGSVTDTSGGVLPGATVEVKNNRTGVATNTVTNTVGAFDVPAIDPGIYTVTISLNGFKTSVMKDVELLSGTARAIKLTLEVGGLTDKVEVVGGNQLIQTQSTAISSTMRVEQISNLPLITRNGLNLVVQLPSVDTGGSNHSQRSSTVSGLPQSALSITVDGANVQDKYTRSTDGFFVNIHPKLDLIEEVTVSTATAGADASGQGAVQIKFATRSGTNTFAGSAYEYHRDRDLNTNYYFNTVNGLDKNVLTLNQWGFRQGGPIVMPGLYDGRGKAFFFFNFEQLRFPLSNTRDRTILSPAAQAGNLTFAGGTFNVFTVAQNFAAANPSLQGITTTPDPVIAALLTKIRTGAESQGIINNRPDPNLQQYLWQPESLRIDNSPGGRIDYNFGAHHRLSVSYNYQGQRLNPNLFGGDEPNFPGLSNSANLYSAVSRGSVSFRSTLGANLVNEVRMGISNAPVWFADEVELSQFSDQGGFSISFPAFATPAANANTPTNATTNAAPSSRNGKSFNLDESVNWIRRDHSINFGASFSRVSGWTKAQSLVPTLSLGVDTTGGDLANGMFTGGAGGNFTNASGAELTEARALYALLTGRVTSITSNARLDGPTGTYVYLGPGRTKEHQDEIGVFIQDSWRFRPNLTLNGGLRWQIQMPFQADNSVYSRNTLADACGVSGLGDGPGGRDCNFFNAGVFNAGGRTPVYELYTAGNKGYNTEYTNFAPNVGVAWLPNIDKGFLRKVLGDPTQATIRASFGVAYNSDGLGFFQGVYNGNPGNQITTTRTPTSTQFPLVPAGSSWPVLLREPATLGPSAGIPAGPVYPMAIDFNSGVNMIHPNFKTPFTRSFSVGLQRTIGPKMAIEIRYVGTRLLDGTATEDWNEINWTSNGFLNEFKLAQANLQANLAAFAADPIANANRNNSFGYFGPGTNTSPLPIYLAAFAGSAAATNTALYTNTNFTNSARLTELAKQNPTPQAAATTLYNTANFRTNMLTAGLPSNFFVLNPAVVGASGNTSGVSVTTNGNRTKYDSLQLIFRRSLSNGLVLDSNYVYSTRYATTLDTLRLPRQLVRSTQGVPHALKLTALYELPFGQGKRFGTNANRWVNGAIGGWSLNLAGRVQSGTIMNFGNVRVVGMSQKELQDVFKVRIDAATKNVFMLPQDIIDNTIKAFNVSATTASGYGAAGPPSGKYLAPANGPDCIQEVRGDCAPHDVFVTGPIFTRFDLNARKKFNLTGRKSFEVGVDVMNLFNAINFNPVASASANANNYLVTQAYQDPNVTFDPGGRLMQLMVRFNW